VAAEHENDCSFFTGGFRYCIDDELEVAGDEDVGQR